MSDVTEPVVPEEAVQVLREHEHGEYDTEVPEDIEPDFDAEDEDEVDEVVEDESVEGENDYAADTSPIAPETEEVL